MESIGVRELRQNASRYLAQVASSGEPIEITDRGRPIARLVPVSSDSWADMIASGEITPAANNEGLREIQPLTLEFDASGELERLRRDER
jgi:prevent-host-death family protein